MLVHMLYGISSVEPHIENYLFGLHKPFSIISDFFSTKFLVQKVIDIYFMWISSETPHSVVF